MTIVITTDVFCDGCGNWVHGVTGPRPDKKNARKEAQRNRWKITHKGDFCPRCKNDN